MKRVFRSIILGLFLPVQIATLSAQIATMNPRPTPLQSSARSVRDSRPRTMRSIAAALPKRSGCSTAPNKHGCSASCRWREAEGRGQAKRLAIPTPRVRVFQRVRRSARSGKRLPPIRPLHRRGPGLLNGIQRFRWNHLRNHGDGRHSHEFHFDAGIFLVGRPDPMVSRSPGCLRERDPEHLPQGQSELTPLSRLPEEGIQFALRRGANRFTIRPCPN